MRFPDLPPVSTPGRSRSGAAARLDGHDRESFIRACRNVQLSPASRRAAADDTPLIRALDIGLSLSVLLISLPLLLLLAAAIKLDGPGPVLFRQQRLGRYCRPFVLIKFRTMIVDAEAAGPRWASGADERITRIGRLLRKSRLDELPQLINIIKGELSFVGPRPIRRHFAQLLSQQEPTYRLRFLVKPGLTGWAQIYAPYGSTVEEQLQKLPFDLRYLEQPLSLSAYLRIIWLTALSMLRGKGV